MINRELADYRYEIKFGTRTIALPELKAWIRSHRAGFRTAHPPRLVNSLYFDSVDYRALSDNLSGIPDRAKLRCRWYGEDLGWIDGRLELKCKRNQLGRKLVRRLDPPIDLRDGDWSKIMRSLHRRELGEFGPSLAESPCPTLIVQYRRAYYISITGEVRLTVDTDLTTYDQVRHSAPNFIRRNIGQAPALVEIKGASEAGDLVAEIAREMPLRQIAYSKYCVGVLDGLNISSI